MEELFKQYLLNNYICSEETATEYARNYYNKEFNKLPKLKRKTESLGLLVLPNSEE